MLTRINALRTRLRRSERKVADLVLERPDDVPGSSIATLAQRAGVSEPTVIRFCRAIGCNGFQDFKLRMAAGLASGEPYVASTVSSKDSPEALSGKVFDRAIASLVQARNHLNTEALTTAVDLLLDAPRIDVYGHGVSGLVAQDAQHAFLRLGIPVMACTDPHIHRISAATLPHGSVLIAISQTGRTAELLCSAELALAAGCRVIAVTACGSPLAEISTVTLYTDVRDDTDSYTPMASRLAHLAVCDVLAMALSMRLPAASNSHLQHTPEARIGGLPGSTRA